MQRKYRIHPTIGIARVGDSPDNYFIGPEVPGGSPSLDKPDAPLSPNSTYKDQKGHIKRQGARFRIYEYTLDDAGAPTKMREITACITTGSSAGLPRRFGSVDKCTQIVAFRRLE